LIVQRVNFSSKLSLLYEIYQSDIADVTMHRRMVYVEAV